MPAPRPFANRIVGSGEEPPDQLLANPRNARIHPKAQQDALAGVLDEVGWVQQVVVNQRTQTLIDGHLRVSLALRRNEPTIPVVYVDLDEAEEALILATLDPLAAMAVADGEKLDALLRDVQTGEAAVQAMLADLAEQSGLIPPDTFDPHAEWTGMPEFEQEDQMPAYRVIVNFASADDVQDFERRIEQEVPRTSKITGSIWFPKVERQRRDHLGYTSDES